MAESINYHWKTEWYVYKFSDEDGELADELHSGLPISIAKNSGRYIGLTKVEDNCALATGVHSFWDHWLGVVSAPFTNATAYIVVGDGITTPASTQTGPAGTTYVYQKADAGYPYRDAETVHVRATFGSAAANFYWKEFCIANGNSTSSVHYNRQLYDIGIAKKAGETFALEGLLTMR